MTRRYLRLLSWLLVGTMLYGQMAIAAYACPRLVSAAAVDASATSVVPAIDRVGDANDAAVDAGMRNCDSMLGSMDPDAQKLCAEHCNYGHQSEQAPSLALPPIPLLTSLYVAPAMPLPSVSAQPAADLSALAEASPPLAILHCCFRI